MLKSSQRFFEIFFFKFQELLAVFEGSWGVQILKVYILNLIQSSQNYYFELKFFGFPMDFVTTSLNLNAIDKLNLMLLFKTDQMIVITFAFV